MSDAGPAIRDFDGEIAQTRRAAETLRSQMADALTAWLDAAAPWAAHFWEGAIAEAVQEKPDVIVALGDDDRKAVKDDAASLITSARLHIQQRLVDHRPEDWPHLKPQTDPGDRAFRPHGTVGPFTASTTKGVGVHKVVPEAVAGRLNGVLGDVASVFMNHGFMLAGFERGDPYGHQGRWHPDRDHKPEWSDEMIEAMAAYAELHRRYVEALIDLARIGDEKKHSEATDLWERT